MPQILPAAAAAISAAAPAVAAAAPTVAGAGMMATLKAVAFNALTNLAISTAMSALQPQVGLAGRSFEFVIDPDGPIPFAAGRIGVSGSVVHRDTFGPDLMYYGIPAVLSGAGPIDGFESFKADDETVTFDGTGMAITSQYANELWYKNKLGTQPDTALVSPTGLKNSVTLPDWTADHKLSGKACFLIVMGENSKQTAFPTGEIKPLVTFRGLKVWDPRLDSTWPGGSGTCRLDDPSTWVYSDDPHLWALKWALGLWEGPTGQGAPQVDYQVGGIGAKLSGIDVAAFIAAANISEANGWTCSAYPNTDDDKHQVLLAFLQAGGSIYAQRAGKISCIQRSAVRTSIVTISAADTAGPLEIDTAASRIDRINTIRPRFWSEEHRWQLTAQPEISIAARVIEDDNQKRTRGIDYTFVNNSTQSGQLAALQIENTREGIAGVIPLKPHLQRIRPGDAFTITEEGFVLDGLKCLCLNTDYDPQTGVVRVSFVSETDGKYAYALGLTPDPPETQALSAGDNTVTPPAVDEWVAVGGSITGDDGAVVPAIAVTGSVENDTADLAIFEYRRVGSLDWTPAGTESPEITRKQIVGLAPGDWEVAVSYRRGRRTSIRTVLDPVTLGPSTASTFVNAGGLAVLDEVDTPQIVAQAVTKPARYDSAASASLVASGAMEERNTVFSMAFTATGAQIEADASFYLKAQHDQDSYDMHLVVEGPSGDVFHATVPAQAISGDGHIFGWQVISFTDTPPAGSVTYYVRVYHTYAIGSPGAFIRWDHANRTMKVREFKR